MSRQDPNALIFRDVACERGGRIVFEGVDVALGSGDALLVTGPNGAGKSSLVRIAAGLLSASVGTVERRGALALLGEGSALDPELPLVRALDFWARIDGGKHALAAVGLDLLAAVPVRLLSTGQRRRAGIARVAASGADVWLLDEPANGLDAAAVATLETLIAKHRAKGGIVVVATHQPVALPGAVVLAL